MFLISRFLNGFAVGMLDTSIPVFQSEISPARQRGRMVGAHGVLIVIGYSAAGFAGFGTYFAAPTVSWRLCLSLQIVAPFLLFVGSPWYVDLSSLRLLVCYYILTDKQTGFLKAQDG